VNFLLLHQGEEEIVVGVDHVVSFTRSRKGGTILVTAVSTEDGGWETVDESPETISRMIRAIGGNVQERQPPDVLEEFRSGGRK